VQTLAAFFMYRLREPKIFVETERLILREILPSDAEELFAMDSDPDVHRYLGNKPIQTIEEVQNAIRRIRNQYIENGIGRWAVLEKENCDFIGWSGLKLENEQRGNHINYYDLGYRFHNNYWGKGFATEAALASMEFGFSKMGLEVINATADVENAASINVLTKSGLKLLETFDSYDRPHHWFGITRQDWEKMKN
jgi:ribosomal-protein-alanine N-acetyltransferase